MSGWMLRSVLALLGIGIGLGMLYLVRRDRLHGSYAIWWVVVSAAVVVFGIFPHLIDWVGVRLGVAYPPILLVIVAMLMLLVKMLTADLDRTRQMRKLRFLAQRMAILEHEVRERRD